MHGLQETRRARPLTLYAPLLLVAGVVLVLDQISKQLALDRLADAPIHLVEDAVSLRLTFNSGGAFSLLQGASSFFLVATIVIVVLILIWARRIEDISWAVGLGMVLGGGLGNLFDRVLRDTGGKVVDFVDLHVWPVFNLADAAISLGVIYILYLSFKEERSSPKAG